MLKAKIKHLLIGTSLEPLVKGTRLITGRRVPAEFTTSGEYWEQRYAKNGDSGAGSYGRLASFKAEILNDFVERHEVSNVIEFGSGDGAQLRLANYPQYIGVDVSETAVRACRHLFSGDASKTFMSVAEYRAQKADLAMSLDVIYHLVEDHIYHEYMDMLFNASERFVVIYSSNREEQPEAAHVRHRAFTGWVKENRKDFALTGRIANRFPSDSSADFYMYKKT